MSTASLSSEYGIEVQTFMQRRFFLVPRRGIKNIVVIYRPVSLPRVRCTERADADAEQAPQGDPR